MSQFTIRDYRPEDRAVVRHICCETGNMGNPIDGFYSDKESFADMFTAYYTDNEPELAVVVEHEGAVVGYVLATRDARKVKDPAVYALKHALTRGLCFRPGTAGFYWRGLADVVADMGGTGRPKIDLDRYPSHTHNNMLPVARGGGGRLTQECFFTLWDRLKAAGSPGLIGEAFADNEAMIGFAKSKLGYVPAGDKYRVPGLRTESGERRYAVSYTRDLTGWEIGAWKEKFYKPRAV